MSNLEITVSQWLAREHGDEVSRATLAQLELRSGDHTLTLLEDRLARTNRAFANLSAYDLALWLAGNWWRLCCEPEREDPDWLMTHSLPAIGGGYVWPNVTMSSDGEQLQVRARPTGGQRWEPVRYLERLDCNVSIINFQESVESFVDCVLRRLASYQIERTELHLIWQDLNRERRQPEVSSTRRFEALLGFDAGSAPDALIAELLADERHAGRAAIDEVVAEFRGAALTILREVDDTLSRHGTLLDSAEVEKLRRERGSWDVAAPPWERGEAAARDARKMWRLSEAPVSSEKLADLVGADPALINDQRVIHVPIPAARWNSRERRTWSAVLRSRWEEGKRFDLCRLIADALVAPDGEHLMPATNAKTSRQRFQRAFAAELLCPFDALVRHLNSQHPEDEDIEGAAHYFGVSPLLVRSKLANNGILPRF